MGKFTKAILATGTLFALVTSVYAMVVKFNAYLVNGGVAANSTYAINMNSYGIDYISAQTIVTSMTIAAQSFSNGSQSFGTLTVSSSPRQGIANTQYCIFNRCVLSGIDWNWDTAGASSATALSITQSLNTKFAGVIVSTVGTGQSVIYSTAILVAASSNYTTYTSTYGALTISGSTTTVPVSGASGAFTGGRDTPFTIGSNVIIGTNTFVTGLPVLFTRGAALSPGPLSAGTTYYVGFVSPPTPGRVNTNFSIATTSTASVVGSFITITSTPTPGGAAQNYTFTPLTIAGVPSYRWDVSNDGVNWQTLTASNGVTISTTSFATYTATGTINTYDFGPLDYAWLRLNVVAPTAGAINFICSVNGKNSNN